MSTDVVRWKSTIWIDIQWTITSKGCLHRYSPFTDMADSQVFSTLICCIIYMGLLPLTVRWDTWTYSKKPLLSIIKLPRFACPSTRRWRGIPASRGGGDLLKWQINIILGQKIAAHVHAILRYTDIMQGPILSGGIDLDLSDGREHSEEWNMGLYYIQFLTFPGTWSGFLSSAVNHRPNAGRANGISYATRACKYNKFRAESVKVSESVLTDWSYRRKPQSLQPSPLSCRAISHPAPLWVPLFGAKNVPSAQMCTCISRTSGPTAKLCLSREQRAAGARAQPATSLS